MSCKRSDIVKQMQAWVGLNEASGSFKKIIDLYNTIKPLPVGYKLKYTDAWCAGTVSAAAQACGATDIIPTECSCPRMITKAKEMGIWIENDAHKPTAGDIMMYDWDDSGSGDNKNSPDHVGVVEKVSGSTITVIEGNYSNAVKRRTLQVNGRYIRGYIVPKYDVEVVVPEEKVNFEIGLRELAKGDEGDVVRALQILLNGHGYNCGTVDGDFGAKTDNAVCEYQQDKRLVVDGIVGPATWSKLLGVM
jgi:hypothetical protein